MTTSICAQRFCQMKTQNLENTRQCLCSLYTHIYILCQSIYINMYVCGNVRDTIVTLYALRSLG